MEAPGICMEAPGVAMEPPPKFIAPGWNWGMTGGCMETCGAENWTGEEPGACAAAPGCGAADPRDDLSSSRRCESPMIRVYSLAPAEEAACGGAAAR